MSMCTSTKYTLNHNPFIFVSLCDELFSPNSKNLIHVTG